MHYFQFHIGDYRSATAHLTNEEDLAYRRLLDMYYDTEVPIPNDPKDVSRKLRVTVDSLRVALTDFFTPTDEGWRHKRCDAEVAAYKRMADGGRKGAAKRWHSEGNGGVIATLSPPVSNPNANHKPITNNHKPSNTATRGTRLPTDWKPNADLAEWSKSERPDLDLRKVFAEFKDYWSSIPSSKGVRLDWDATWRNWIRKQTAAKQTYAQVAADVARTTTPPPANQDAALKQIISDRENCSPPPAHIREMMKGILGVKNA
jgi:uncharacterized protein YdaU (DUF1376 family)